MTIRNLSNAEVEAWVDEGRLFQLFWICFNTLLLIGDSVQFFRAKAEMQRWQEEWESKQAEFLRCIRAFHKSSDVWKELSQTASHDSEIAYANKKSAMFKEMAELATSEFIAAGYEDRLATLAGDKSLADLVMADRVDPENAVAYETVVCFYILPSNRTDY
jgi:hypothetical protein